METWEAITSRRNVRTFANAEIPREQLEQILEAGRRSPSAKNRQPWDFVVVTNQSTLQELSKVWSGAGPVAECAVAVALITGEAESDERTVTNAYDLGQATAHMMIAAADLGVASGHSSVADQDLARTLLGLSKGHRCAYLITLGRPAVRPLSPITEPDRRAFDDVVHWERW